MLSIKELLKYYETAVSYEKSYDYEEAKEYYIEFLRLAEKCPNGTEIEKEKLSIKKITKKSETINETSRSPISKKIYKQNRK